ncbi:MAG: hypothetical protein KatS3mg008_0609 [Acidimicrobiales bacterium]|nr:MAG: hypothetical protein KatS3mg008_0609 [Acidimicrobiales bacterium]
MALVAVVALVPLVVAVRAGQQGWTPTSDLALTALWTRDVFSNETPLVGPFSATLQMANESDAPETVNHPGPSLYWALVLPYMITGWSPKALLFGRVLVDWACLGGIVWLCRRRPRPTDPTILLLIVGFMYARWEADTLVTPWNPFAALPAYLLALVASWRLATGCAGALPVLVAASSFAVQAHFGYAIPLLFPALTATISFLAQSGSPRDALERLRRLDSFWVAVAIALVMWLPPLIDQVAGSGNLAAIVSNSAGATFDGPIPALGNVGRALGLPPLWSRTVEGSFDLLSRGSISEKVVPFLVVASMAALMRATARKGDRDALTLLLIAMAALAGGYVALSLLPRASVFAAHAFRWLQPLSAFVWFALAFALCRLLHSSARRAQTRSRSAHMVQVASTFATAVVVVACASRAVFGPLFEPEENAFVAAVHELRRQLEPVLDPDATYLTISGGDAFIAGLGSALAVQLEPEGYSFVFDDDRAVPLQGWSRKWDGTNAEYSLTIMARWDSAVPASWPPERAVASVVLEADREDPKDKLLVWAEIGRLAQAEDSSG